MDITLSKLAALGIISSELANDSTPEAAQGVGDGIVRDLTRKVDQRLFTATTTNGPGGLPGVSDVTSVSGPASAYSNADPFSDAIYTSAQHNGVITALVTNPATAQALAKVKQYRSAGSNVPLLGADPAMPGHQQILGIPLFTSPYVTTTNNVVWGIPKQFGTSPRQDASRQDRDRT